MRIIQPSLCVREALAAVADAGRVEKRLLLFVDARHKAANRRTAGQRRRSTGASRLKRSFCS
jgi:hypothetical protein